MNKTILLIDDNNDMLVLHKTLLEMEDYKVISAPGGQQALELLSRSESPDLILLDVNMDGMSGPEFLKILERQYPALLDRVPIVFVTGGDEPKGTRATGFIKKALDIDEFLKNIKSFIKS